MRAAALRSAETIFAGFQVTPAHDGGYFVDVLEDEIEPSTVVCGDDYLDQPVEVLAFEIKNDSQWYPSLRHVREAILRESEYRLWYSLITLEEKLGDGDGGDIRAHHGRRVLDLDGRDTSVHHDRRRGR